MKTIKRRTIYTGTALHSTLNRSMFSKKTKAGKQRRNELATKYRSMRKTGVPMRRGYTIT